MAWIMLLMNLDAIFIKLFVEENKLDYSTEENVPNVSLCPTITGYLFGYMVDLIQNTQKYEYQILFTSRIHFR